MSEAGVNDRIRSVVCLDNHSLVVGVQRLACLGPTPREESRTAFSAAWRGPRKDAGLGLVAEHEVARLIRLASHECSHLSITARWTTLYWYSRDQATVGR